MLMTARGVDCGATSCFPCPARSRLGYPPCLALCFTLLCYVLCFPSPILCFSLFYQVLYPTLSSVLASRAFCLPYLAFGFSLPCPLPYPDLSFFLPCPTHSFTLPSSVFSSLAYALNLSLLVGRYYF